MTISVTVAESWMNCFTLKKRYKNIRLLIQKNNQILELSVTLFQKYYFDWIATRTKAYVLMISVCLSINILVFWWPLTLATRWSCNTVFNLFKHKGVDGRQIQHHLNVKINCSCLAPKVFFFIDKIIFSPFSGALVFLSILPSYLWSRLSQ